MRWRGYEGAWHTGFALFPVRLSGGDVIWLEPFRYYVNQFGVVSTILSKEQ